MESSVRYIQLPNAGQKPALCFRGENRALAVINDTQSIHTLEVSLQEHDKAAVVKRLGQDYMPRAFADAMRQVVSQKNKPITRLADYLITSLRENAAIHEQNLKIEPEDKFMPQKEEPENEEADYRDSEVPEKAPPRKIKKLPKKNGQAAAPDPLGMVSGLQAIARSGKAANGSAGGPRPADRTPKPSPIAPLPNRAAAAVRKDVQAKAKRVGGKTLVSVLAAEAGLAQQPCRVKLRAAGLRAPYDEKNEAACRKALGLPTKGKK